MVETIHGHRHYKWFVVCSPKRLTSAVTFELKDVLAFGSEECPCCKSKRDLNLDDKRSNAKIGAGLKESDFVCQIAQGCHYRNSTF